MFFILKPPLFFNLFVWEIKNHYQNIHPYRDLLIVVNLKYSNYSTGGTGSP